MGIPKHLTMTVSGLVFAGLTFVAGPAAAAEPATPACPENVNINNTNTNIAN